MKIERIHGNEGWRLVGERYFGADEYVKDLGYTSAVASKSKDWKGWRVVVGYGPNESTGYGRTRELALNEALR